MTPGARVQAAIEILDEVGAGAPAERALTNWGRRSRFAGSKDRAAVRDHVYDVLRRWRTAAARGGGETGRALMAGNLTNLGEDPAAFFTGEGHAPASLTAEEQARLAVQPDMSAPEAVDLPDWLWPQWIEALGPQSDDVAATLRHRAGVFLRVNVGRASVAECIDALAAEDITTELVPDCPTALRVTTNQRRVNGSEAMARGLFDIQDPASQRAVARLPLMSGARVLDYCAGGGGKSVAMADLHGADVTAFDAEAGRMADIPRRASAAGVSITIAMEDDLKTVDPFDLVLCDAPCSGSGTWRRTPEAKWRLTPNRLAELTALQGTILDATERLVRPGGHLAYATCSVLRAENEAVVEAFLQRHTGWEVIDEMRLLPGCNSDGFYLSVFRGPSP